MTVRQQAYNMIDELSDDNVKVVIRLMSKMIPYEQNDRRQNENPPDSKMQAFLELQEMRKKSKPGDFSRDELDAALNEKYGVL